METIVEQTYQINGIEITITANMDSTWTVTYDSCPDEPDTVVAVFTGSTLLSAMTEFNTYLMNTDSRFYTDLITQLNRSFETYIINPNGLDVEFKGVMLASIQCNDTNCTYDLYQTLRGNYIAIISNRAGRFDWNHWENMDLERQKIAVRDWLGSSAGAKALYSQVGISYSVVLN